MPFPLSNSTCNAFVVGATVAVVHGGLGRGAVSHSARMGRLSVSSTIMRSSGAMSIVMAVRSGR